ncbi:hypothetical protein SteCoe_29565 [Stentor coeruleus]|uniref:Uncharacterized protein n=1 Tax=Stentor coeruleus TaxID=5963 RepID=A0A1R2B5L6_9CILI|nr:hypothetical protein SteCoe_29565 [Stentor coeruleus]
MEFRNKGREEVNRLLSDRQAYITSLELKLEKFTQNTQSYLDIKEKIDKLANVITSSEERIQGLNWIIKQQNETHQQQIKSLSSRYEDLSQHVSTLAISYQFQSTPLKISTLDIKPPIFDYTKITKDLESLIKISTEQVKSELEQRIDLLQSKNSVLSKSYDTRSDILQVFEDRIKQDVDSEMKKFIVQTQNLVHDFEYKLEAAQEMNSERYKEIVVKANGSSLNIMNEELGGLKQKIFRLEEYKKVCEDNETRRELEVKEASQSAWTVESQLKQLQKDIDNLRPCFSSQKPSFQPNDIYTKLEERVNYLGTTVKKYLQVQKALHKKVENLCDVIKDMSRQRSKSAEKGNSSRSKGRNNGESSFSPSLGSSRASMLKPSGLSRPKSTKTQHRKAELIYYTMNLATCLHIDLI